MNPGYWIEEGVFSPSECEKILLGLQSDDCRAGLRNLMSNATAAAVANDPRLLRLAKRTSGRSLTPFKAILFNKTGKANWLVAWHQDTALPIEEFTAAAGWTSPSTKGGVMFAQAPASVLEKILALRIHLDPSTETNGPLRVIPGSHSEGVLNDTRSTELVSCVSPVECLVGRGGVMAMSPLVLHASSKIASDEPRRVLHIEYAESLKLECGITLAVA